MIVIKGDVFFSGSNSDMPPFISNIQSVKYLNNKKKITKREKLKIIIGISKYLDGKY